MEVSALENVDDCVGKAFGVLIEGTFFYNNFSKLT